MSATGDPLRQDEKRLTELNQSERREVEQLVRRDREVKAHEMAHKAAAGSLATGAASFDYAVGPDGKRYAVGGEVDIDISKQADPATNLEKARTIRRAALAPSDPSAQDRRIAAQATRIEAEAHQELLQERSDSTTSSAEVSERMSEGDPSMTTRNSQRGLNLYKTVESTASATGQSPFDQFI